MMKISFIAVWLLLAVGAIAAMFHITFEVEKLEARLHEINRQIVWEQESIHVLQAEWSYLNRPQRLELLSQELLPNLVPVASAQFITFARLPKRSEAGGLIDAPTVAPARFTPAAKHAMRGRHQ
ncbi:MAG: cell division protein FtsL [Alphaproteobacteria bacterium]